MEYGLLTANLVVTPLETEWYASRPQWQFLCHCIALYLTCIEFNVVPFTPVAVMVFFVVLFLSIVVFHLFPFMSLFSWWACVFVHLRRYTGAHVIGALVKDSWVSVDAHCVSTQLLVCAYYLSISCSSLSVSICTFTYIFLPTCFTDSFHSPHTLSYETLYAFIHRQWYIVSM